MSLIQSAKTNPEHYPNLQKSPVRSRKSDEDIKENIYQAFWKDSVLRTIEYYEIDIRVVKGFVSLKGHIADTRTNLRIEAVLDDISGILKVKNELIFDDALMSEVSAGLTNLEQKYGCSIFTGVSHGVVSLNGFVGSENLKLLVEQEVAGNQNVRGVINHLQLPGGWQAVPHQPFLQPTIGENIYFLDGVYGVVRQVIINPNNRCVIAMVTEERFEEQRRENLSIVNHEVHSGKQRFVLPMLAVRYFTRASGFLDIHSNERNRYREFNPADFFSPKKGWNAPFPYCPEDVLFSLKLQDFEKNIMDQYYLPLFSDVLVGQSLEDQLATNDSLGG